jgi:hypothetical protein
VNGHVRSIRALVEQGADPNRRGTFGGPGHGEGITAIHLAAQAGRREAVIALLVLVFALSTYGQASALMELSKGGQGYASFQWYDSKSMEFLRGLPASTKIYTNEPGAVYFYIGRGAYVLPDRFDSVTAEARTGFEHGVEKMQVEIKAGQAVLALFGGDNPSPEDAYVLSQGLYLAHKSAGDEIYTAAP